MTESPSISIVIPTYNRGNVLLDTIHLLLKQKDQAGEILIIDQTSYEYYDQSYRKLKQLDDDAKIVWVKLSEPSIPAAMNKGLVLASSQYVLFLDDDVIFENSFIHEHRLALINNISKNIKTIGQVGQIIQPWQTITELNDYHPGEGLNRDLHFPFHCDQSRKVKNAMAGNLCVHRESAIKSGGFDERFDKTSYRFETEFCKRLCRDYEVEFDFIPEASLNHLHVDFGGTRAHGDFFNSWQPIHSSCNYYFALKEGSFFEAIEYIFRRFIKSFMDKFYLRKPWFIPVRLVAELRGIARAISMLRSGPIYIEDSNKSS